MNSMLNQGLYSAPEVNLLIEEVSKIYESYMRSKERYFFLINKASSAGAIRYDKLRVQSSNTYDLGDLVLEAIEAEGKAKHQEELYQETMDHFRSLMDTANFAPTQQDIWIKRYAESQTMGKIAKQLNITKSKVQYLLNDNQADKLASAIRERRN